MKVIYSFWECFLFHLLWWCISASLDLKLVCANAWRYHYNFPMFSRAINCHVASLVCIISLSIEECKHLNVFTMWTIMRCPVLNWRFM